MENEKELKKEWWRNRKKILSRKVKQEEREKLKARNREIWQILGEL